MRMQSHLYAAIACPGYASIGNMAAIMEVADDMNRTFQKFEPAPRRGEPEVSWCSASAYPYLMPMGCTTAPAPCDVLNSFTDGCALLGPTSLLVHNHP